MPQNWYNKKWTKFEWYYLSAKLKIYSDIFEPESPWNNLNFHQSKLSEIVELTDACTN